MNRRNAEGNEAGKPTRVSCPSRSNPRLHDVHVVILTFTIQEMMGVLWDYDGDHAASWPYAEMKIKKVSIKISNLVIS